MASTASTAETVGKITVAMLATAGLVLIAPMLGVLSGSLSGWVVGLFWPRTMAALIAWFGLHVAPWQFGAMLGFVGGFFRVSRGSKS